ncbi:MAG: hypothetical protein ABR555_15525 [Pyrinomonadaceae bacterium]
MERQHTENLFRRYKGEIVNVKTISGGIYEGRVSEITNDYVGLLLSDAAQVFLFFTAIESITSTDVPAS